MMEKHRRLLALKCRICARSVKNDKRRKSAREYAETIRETWRVNVNLDSPNVHPPYICNRCYAKTTNIKDYSGQELDCVE